MKKTKKILFFYLLISFIVINVIWLLYSKHVFEKGELSYTDFSFNLREKYGNPPEDKGIVIVKIDNKTISKISELGKNLTEVRDVYGYIVQKAYENGAKIVAFDIMFQSFNQNSAADLYFYNTIKESKGVVLSAFVDNGKTGELILPNEIFLNANEKNGIGLINMYVDSDNKVRKGAIFYKKEKQDGSEGYPAFAVEIYRKVKGLSSIEQLDEDIYNKFKRDGDKLHINYRGGTIMGNSSKESFKSISCNSIIEEALGVGKFDYSVFKDKIVIVGAAYSAGQDFYMTPFNKGVTGGASSISTPGVEIHAQMLNTLLNNREIERKQISYHLYLLIAVIVAVMYIPVYRTWISTGSLFILTVSMFAVSQLLFFRDISVDFIQFFVTAVVLYFTSIAYKTVWEKNEKKRIKEIFGKYVAKSIVEDVIKNEEKLDVGGRVAEATILFADIEGFTSISEACSDKPAKLVEYLNIYFDKAIDVVDENSGMVDKMIGDAVMALFGVPVENKNHAEMAVRTAIGLKKIAQELSEMWKSELGKGLNVRVGINSGDVIAGHIGSKSKKIEYTVIGDNVNLSSRLEGANKYFGTSIMISENVYERLEDKSLFLIREIDTIRVKGKERAVKVYEVAGYSSEVSEEIKKKTELFNSGMELYKNMKFEEALEIFNKISEDRVSEIYCKRCMQCLKNPPGENWDGVCELQEK